MREVTPAKLHFSKQNSCGIEYRNFTIKYFNFRNIRYIFKIKNGSFKIIQCNIKIKCLNLRNNFFNFWNNSGNFRSKYWIFSINYYNAKIKCCLQFLISKLKPTASKCEAMQIRIKFGNFKKKCSNIINLEFKKSSVGVSEFGIKKFPNNFGNFRRKHCGKRVFFLRIFPNAGKCRSDKLRIRKIFTQ